MGSNSSKSRRPSYGSSRATSPGTSPPERAAKPSIKTNVPAASSAASPSSPIPEIRAPVDEPTDNELIQETRCVLDWTLETGTGQLTGRVSVFQLVDPAELRILREEFARRADGHVISKDDFREVGFKLLGLAPDSRRLTCPLRSLVNRP
jgi:hypothetical protein